MKIFIFSIMLVLLSITGCDNTPTGPGTGGGKGGGGNDGGGNGGGGGTGNVAFSISTQQGNQGGIIMSGTPNQSVTITQVVVSVPAAQFQETYNGDGTTVYSANQSISIDEFTGVQSGQQWTFRFQGKIGNAQGQAYDVTTNYSVP